MTSSTHQGPPAGWQQGNAEAIAALMGLRCWCNRGLPHYDSGVDATTFLSRPCEAPPRQLLRPNVASLPSSPVQIPFWQRLLAPLIYLLPWSDAIPFGLGADGVFNQIPLLRLLIVPAVPLIQLDRGVPFGGLLLFFVLFLAVVRNPAVPYFLRFNTLQALLTDIVIVVLSFAFGILLQPIAGGSLLLSTLSSTIVVAVLAILLFALVECWRGREPDLPGISQAVRMQLY